MTKTRRKTGLAAAAAGCLVLFGAAPASAGLSYVEGTQATGVPVGTQGDTPDAECPAGAKVTGGGVYSTGLYDQASITSSYRPDSHTWDGRVDMIGTIPQNIFAVAICWTGDPTYSKESKDLNGVITKKIRAACPAGHHILGGGFRSNGIYDQVRVRASRPYDGGDSDSRLDDGWELAIDQQTGSSRATVWAVCSMRETRIKKATVPVNPESLNSGSRRCPSSRHVTGGGAKFSGVLGLGTFNTLYPEDDDSPTGDADVVPDDIWRAYANNHDDTNTAKLTVYAVCR